MEQAINYLISHPVLFVIAIIIAVMVLFSSLKKLIRLVVLIAAILVLYAAYLHFTGGDIHAAFVRIEQSFNAVIHFFAGLFSSLLELLKSSKKQ
ncbi:MAG: hypothetical protein FDX30_11285 [Chlorobium sp.]|nr:MAG: hypothetical protein FDX30_11285 [Chlorobium sp.]